MRTISPTLARRLAITRQRLAGPRPAATVDGIFELVRDLGCLQLDPISAVARSHLLVLWSRLGAYDPASLETLLWDERRLFEYWAHAASIVLTEDYPIHSLMMHQGDAGLSGWRRRLHQWVAENAVLRDQILSRLRESGPLPARTFADLPVSVDYLTFVEGKINSAPSAAEPPADAQPVSRGWNWGRNVDRMLSFLWSRGEIMVAGRSGGQKLWDLAERRLPEWTA
ncbi:MAG TPA: crosslink repair DNA glycosylase YcaQ family protein, partial [Steroidobacteraceae bacterium]|nr:crosslink repair DNA glycosylase YcaQ family protein [Steroidobacteraceae bacterium]